MQQNPNHTINFELYKIFYHAANTLNFSKAATTLHVTQSAISQAIKSLETQLGIALFFRQGRNVTLTFEGEVLFQHIEKAFNFIHSAENSIHSIKSLDEGTVFIGASDTITRYFLIDAIKSFHAEHPRVRISINNRPSPRSVEKLINGELDLAIINISPNATYEGLELYPLATLEHIFINRIPLGSKPFALKELSKHPLVCLEQNSTTRRVLDDFYRSKDLTLDPAFEFGSYDVILEAVKSGMGVGFVPKKIAIDALQSALLVEIPLKESIPSIDIGILINKSKPLSLAAQKFIEILRKSTS